MCNFCDKSFTTFMSFSGHMSAFHEGNEAKMCELCGKSFNQPNNLKIEKFFLESPSGGFT